MINKDIIIPEFLKGKSYEDIVLEPFTLREYEIFELYALGNVTKKIVDKLFLSRGTVLSHRANFFSKLSVEKVPYEMGSIIPWIWLIFGSEIKEKSVLYNGKQHRKT